MLGSEEDTDFFSQFYCLQKDITQVIGTEKSCITQYTIYTKVFLPELSICKIFNLSQPQIVLQGPAENRSTWVQPACQIFCMQLLPMAIATSSNHCVPASRKGFPCPPSPASRTQYWCRRHSPINTA